MKNRKPKNEQEKVIYTFDELLKDVDFIINIIKIHKLPIKCIYAIPRGGLVLGAILSNKLNMPLYLHFNEIPSDYAYQEILVCDDISDYGKTLKKIPNIDKMNTATLFIKDHTCFVPDIYCRKEKEKNWIIFPWE